MKNIESIENQYKYARERYHEIGVNPEEAMKTLESIPLSLHCWQGDDVGGFETGGGVLSGGGIQATGQYHGRARNHVELRMDLQKAFSLIPGSHRLNLHAHYGEFGGKKIDRDAVEPAHFQGWIDWARDVGVKLDFNSTYFSHPKAEAGFTLSSKEAGVRAFWIEHAKRCRKISAEMGRQLHSPCIHDIWIPDGAKDITIDRWGHRELLKESLDDIFKEQFDSEEMKDAVESKLFGIGSEYFVVGSHEFYLGYVVSRKKMLCMDMGHFHPTESVSDKISAVMQFSEELLLHVSRPVRWDSDHVVIMSDDVVSLTQSLVRCRLLNRVHLALDYFDASMNRVGAYVIGSRAVQKALLFALLEPVSLLKENEEKGDFFARLALLEEMKSMPFPAVWNYFCLKMDVPVGTSYIDEIEKYDNDVLHRRG